MFFESLAAEQHEERTAKRRAVIVAKARVDERMGSFLRAASNMDEFRARLDLVMEDVEGIVATAGEEYGITEGGPILDSVVASFYPEEVTQRIASTQHEARKPKMCPYHSEVTQISLAQGEPQAGFNAMAQHAWGQKHCQGEWEGKCNFKPEMTTQKYWDDKAEAAEQRKREREEQRAQEAELQAEAPVVEEVNEEESAVGVGIDEVSEDTGDVDVGFDATTTEPVEEVPMAMAASHVGDKVATEATGLGEPSPKMDKRLWTPQNVRKIEDVDDSNGSHPTKTVDPTEPIEATNDGDLSEIGEQVTEHQGLPSSENAGFDAKKLDGEQGGTFPKGNQADPVTSKAQDITKNPIREILDNEFEGFVPRSDIDAALS